MNSAARMLASLKAQEGQFISGARLSRELGISRTAIWKHVHQLRQFGAEIESQSGKGYRLLFLPDRLERPQLQDLLVSRLGAQHPFANLLRVYDVLDSTQAEAHRLANGQEAANGTVILADGQTAGRGRLQRSWQSPAGRGIWLSVILRPELAVQWASQWTLLAAVAVCRALRAHSGLAVGIKWPNDLLIDGRKCCGILLETVAEANRVQYMVIGIGINVNQATADFPFEWADQVTSLRMAGGQVFNRASLIAGVLTELQAQLNDYAANGFAPIRAAWQQLNVSLGRRVRITTQREVFEGVAHDIDEFGALLLQADDGSWRKNYSGDLELLPVP